jgi:hypothetical protein
MDGCMDGWVIGMMYIRMEEWFDVRMDVWMDGWVME